MDELEIAMLIRKCKILKYKFKGVFAADNFPPLTNNSFVIVNSSRANNIGTHWILFCKRENNIIFADPLGCKLEFYGYVYRRAIKLYDKVQDIMLAQLQPLDSNACGLYCIFLAHEVFGRHYPRITFIAENDLYRFVKHMY